MPRFLVIDIGGTNTRIALSDGPTLGETTLRRYRNADNPGGLPVILSHYLDDLGHPRLDGACAGVAGPVRDGVAHLTNVDWVIDRATLAGATGAPICAVINDMQAQGHGLDALAPEATPVVHDGPIAPPPAARLVINIGTGFNSLPVLRDGDRVITPPGETGHMTLPGKPAYAALVADLTKWHGYATIEQALSGQGLENLYRHVGGAAGTRASDIMAGVTASDATATAALRLMVDILGTVTGDLALACLPFGGIYLTGGVAGHIAPHLGALGFAQSLGDKGDFSDLMGEFRVHLIADDSAALRGSARYLQQLCTAT